MVQIDLFSMEIFENIAYIMAKHAEPDKLPDSPEEWLDVFFCVVPNLVSA